MCSASSWAFCSSSIMFTSFCWVSWKPAIGLPNCGRLLAYSSAACEARARRADRAPDDPEARLAQARQRPAHARHAGQHGVVGQPHVVEHQLRGDRRAQRVLAVDVLRGEARRLARHEEPADAVVGARPHDGDVGQAAVRDPHLRAAHDPVRAVAPRARLHRPTGRCPRRARSGRSSRRARRAPCPAASAPSAPRSRRSRSGTWPASPARTRSCAARCRPPRARGRRRRSSSRSRPRTRSRSGACRAARARRSPAPSSRGNVPSSYQRSTSGSTRSAAKRRTVSAIRRSSSDSSASRSSGSAGRRRWRSDVEVAVMRRATARPSLVSPLHAQDAVVAVARAAAAVAVARRHPQRAVRCRDDGAQPAVLAVEQRLGRARVARRRAARATAARRAARRRTATPPATAAPLGEASAVGHVTSGLVKRPPRGVAAALDLGPAVVAPGLGSG